MLNVTNISTYKFAPLTNLKPLKQELLGECKARNLKGTILLSQEGINLFLAGSRENIDYLVNRLRRIPGLEDLTPKISESDHQPFTRMLVKIKKEIIAFGIDGIDPGRRTSPKLPAKELKKWLDEGKPVTLLDTRNDYEVKLGTFKNALPIGIKHFRQFPEAVRNLPKEMKDAPIVMFCTGGIRCEKAGPFMEQEGFKKIFQLDGGILKYFEEVGPAHYDGSCFVFDQRVGVDPSLHESTDKQCFLCLSPLTVEDQKDPRYQLGKSCPYCYKSPDEELKQRVQAKNEELKKITSPLPGKMPYDNLIPMKIPERLSEISLEEFLKKAFPYEEAGYWASECANKKILNNKHEAVSGQTVVHTGERYLHLRAQTSEPDVNADIQILFEDEALLVIDKPAPLPVQPSGRYHRNTLKFILDKLYYPLVPRPAHRLDANTQGVMVFSKTQHFARFIQPQFSERKVEKLYEVRVQGHPKEDSFSCNLPISEGTAKAGGRVTSPEGLEALTHFKVIRRDIDGTSLIEATPVTGRTNQIRVHLWHLGFPVCNDPLYLVDKKLGDKQTHDTGNAPLKLLSKRITLTHPVTKQKITFESAKTLCGKT